MKFIIWQFNHTFLFIIVLIFGVESIVLVADDDADTNTDGAAAAVTVLPRIVRGNEMCTMHNGRRIYLEPGDKGLLLAKNISTHFHKFSKNNSTIPLSSPFLCNIELVTCSTCIIKVTIRTMNFSTHCLNQKNNKNIDYHNHHQPTCNCDYLWFSEPPYDSLKFGKLICGSPAHEQYVISKTRTLSIKYYYRYNNNNNHSNAFTLNYSAERNRHEIVGGLPPNNSTTQQQQQQQQQPQFITSPYFPMLYPRDFGIENIITCHSENCRIRVLFSDYQISVVSSMEFFDWNGERIGIFFGNIFRPPVIISNGPSMIIRFLANGDTGLGYRAELTFLSDPLLIGSSSDDAHWPIIRPSMNCGGIVADSLGGAITMMNMVNQNDTKEKYYDCVWLIKSTPSNENYLHMKTHILLKIDSFNNMGIGSELIIKQGITSDRPNLETFTWSELNQMNGVTSKSYVVTITTGFYIRLRGHFNSESRLALVYSAFSYMDCYIGSEFLCQNQRCIQMHLHCDGFDHCGDGSDEPESCVTEIKTGQMEKNWYAHRSNNYFFPKIDDYPDLKTATVVFIISCIGLIFIITTLIILLLRIGSRARHHRELQSHLQTISELLENNSQHEDQSTPPPPPPEEPPEYEAPPTYDEVIKVGMEDQMNCTIQTQPKTINVDRNNHTISTIFGPIIEPSVYEVIIPVITTSNETTLNELVADTDTAIDSGTPSNGPTIDNSNQNNRFSEIFLSSTQLIAATTSIASDQPSFGHYTTKYATNNFISTDSQPPSYTTTTMIIPNVSTNSNNDGALQEPSQSQSSPSSILSNNMHDAAAAAAAADDEGINSDELTTHSVNEPSRIYQNIQSGNDVCRDTNNTLETTAATTAEAAAAAAAAASLRRNSWLIFDNDETHGIDNNTLGLDVA